MARIATNNTEDALDIVQDSMEAFAGAYAGKPPEMWKPLFYKVVQNKIRDWLRRERFRATFKGVLARVTGRGEELGAAEDDPIGNVADPRGRTPEEQALANGFIGDLHAALSRLSHRKRQVFLLRTWEGLSIEEAALAMGCSPGSVKSYHSRALEELRNILAGYQP